MLSIITVNLDNRDGLLRTVGSILSQDSSDFECVVIDGGSTDGSIDALYDVLSSCRHSKKFQVTSEKDRGIYDAMNKGLRLARGDWVMFLNSGDCFQNDTRISAVKCVQQSIEDSCVALLAFGFRVDGINRLPRGIGYRIWKMPTSHQAMVFKKSSLPTDPFSLSYRYAADYDLVWRLVNQDRFGFMRVSEPLVENEPYGSRDFQAMVESEYLQICRQYLPCCVCRLVSIARSLFDRYLSR